LCAVLFIIISPVAGFGLLEASESDDDQPTEQPPKQSEPSDDANGAGSSEPGASQPASLEPVPVYEQMLPGSAGVADPTYYSLGFTSESVYGSMTVREDPGRGGFSAELTVINAITDETLVEADALNWDHEQVADLAYPDDLETIADYFIDFWADEYGEFGLAPRDASHRGSFKDLPIEYEGVEYFAEFDVVYGGEDPAFDNIEAYDFWLRGANDMRKLVYSASPRAVEVAASGYFASPFEDRVVIVLLEKRYSFEGHEPFAVLTGSNMAVGFEPVE
jgi:hypothetical protein